MGITPIEQLIKVIDIHIMGKIYQIIDDEIISVNDDGSISRLGKIDESGQIVGVQEKVRVVNESSGASSFFAWFFFIVAVVLGLLTYVTYNKDAQAEEQLHNQLNSANRTISSLQSTIDDLKSQQTDLQLKLSKANTENAQLRSDISKLKDQIDLVVQDFGQLTTGQIEREVRNSAPLSISDIQIGNTDQNDKVITNFGDYIFSSSTMYLKPKLTYYGLTSGTITVYVKFYGASGKLSQGTQSPSGYSYSCSINVHSGTNSQVLSGWGGNDKGYWPKGNYRIEIWYHGDCLASKQFTVY